jgi:23S rRNA (uracil1939-C5)-methyltransferase
LERVLAKFLIPSGRALSEVLNQESTLYGKKLFVEGMIPGETGNIEITNNYARYAEARLINLIDQSSHRIQPICSVFGACGGCDLQFIEIKHQRKLKLEMLERELRHRRLIEEDLYPQMIGGEISAFQYRNRATLHLSQEESKVGFYIRGSSDVVEFTSCAILSKKLEKFRLFITPLLLKHHKEIASVAISEHAEEARVFTLLKLREGATFSDQIKKLVNEIRLFPANVEVLEFQGERHIFDGDEDIGESFSQVNREANAFLQNCVREMVSGEEVSEFYAGSGNLSFPLVADGKKVLAIESDKRLVAYGEKKAIGHNISHLIRFICERAEKFIINKKYLLSSTILLDPPRSGAKIVVEQLATDIVKEIVYVSCNLPTLIRDLAILVDKGYKINQVKAIDMFPQTQYLEVVARLVY